MPRKKSRQRRNETIFYVVEISSWDWSYSFGAVGDCYSELRNLQIDGCLLRPRSIKAERVELHLLPNERYGNRRKDSFVFIGSLNLVRGTLQGLMHLPAAALGPVLQMLISERFRYVVIEGSRLRYRQGTIRNYRLDTTFDEDDLPPDSGKLAVLSLL